SKLPNRAKRLLELSALSPQSSKEMIMLSSIFGRREQEKEVKEMNRLPPGQSLTQKFPVLHYGPTAQYKDLSQWDLRVFGEVEEEVRWTWEQFNQLPRTKLLMDIHCVTRWSKFDT